MSSTNTRAADDVEYIRKRMEEIEADRNAAQQPKTVTPITPVAPKAPDCLYLHLHHPKQIESLYQFDRSYPF